MAYGHSGSGRRVREGLLLALLLVFGAAPAAGAEVVRIAVASNFAATLERLARAYEETTATRLVISAGSSGKHFAQIRQGAPFDIFFSADDQRTRDLVAGGQAVADSRFVYAQGTLVLWSADAALVPEDGARFLGEGDYQRLAMANPRLAPYGAAAAAVLADLDITLARGRLVMGQNIGQTFNFVTTGNAEAGFVALSQVLNYERDHRAGSRWSPDPGSYPPILQEAVLLTEATAAAEGRNFLQWIRDSAEAREIIASDGYGLPARDPGGFPTRAHVR